MISLCPHYNSQPQFDDVSEESLTYTTTNCCPDFVDVNTSIKNMMASVYDNLRAQPRIIRKRSPELNIESYSESERPKAALQKEDASKKKKLKKRVKKSKKRMTGGASPHKIYDEPKARPLPQMQADLMVKQMQHMRRSGGSEKTDSFENQKRLREVLRQKRILEEMLAEHKKLQRDRQHIASEMHTIRSFLNSVRGKVDNSLRKLNTQKTLVEKKLPAVTSAACRREIALRYSPKLSIQTTRSHTMAMKKQRQSKKRSQKEATK